MTTITLQGKPLHTIGHLPVNGQKAPDFSVTTIDLSPLTLHDCLGTKTILNIFPSIDTPTCARATITFNEKTAHLDNTKVLCISADLPFALKRFCGAEHLEHVIPASVFRNPEFGEKYGVRIIDGPLTGLLSRAVILINEKGIITYTQQVPEISTEPDYNAVLNALNLLAR